MVVGLGVMGANLALRIADTCSDLLDGPVQAYDAEAEKREAMRALLETESNGSRVVVRESIQAAAGSEESAVFVMVPATAVASVLSEISPLLSSRDAIIECGNSHFQETDRRSHAATTEAAFFGLGVSGGAYGARNGPSLMLGGPQRHPVWDLLKRIAARFHGEPCLVHCGPGGAGHYVKMVHNAIEYSLMQGIGESVDRLLRLGVSAEQAATICESWNNSPKLSSYLLEITAEVLRVRDTKTNHPLLDFVSPAVGQKGTGAWALSAAIEAGVPVPMLSAAVMTRLGSPSIRADEDSAGGLTRATPTGTPSENELAESQNALSFVWESAFREGLALLEAGGAFGFSPDVRAVLRAWRGGCIIRCSHLEDLLAQSSPFQDAPALLTAPRAVLARATTEQSPMPVLCAAVAAAQMRAGTSPGLGILSLQRDYFGHHGFKRRDEPGLHHLPSRDD